MKLLKLTLRNFRGFYGTQVMEFSGSDTRNTTIVYGANGAGKSTLLNAFTWALYNKFTPSFEDPGRLLSNRAIREAALDSDIEAFVEVAFEHNGDEYTVKRLQIERKVTASATALINKAVLSLTIRQADGRTVDRGNAEETIEQILPKDLYNFFFFDGERMEKLVSPQGRSEVSRAIKSLLDLEILERSIRHLLEAQKQLETDVQSGPASEMALVQKNLDADRVEVTSLRAELETESENTLSIGEEIDAVESQLRTLEHVKSLQIQRDHLDTQRRQLGESRGKALSAIQARIGVDGFTLFLGEPISAALSEIEVQRSKGQLPSKIKRQFVEDLLDKGQCICGTQFTKGDEHELRLRALLETAGRPSVDEAVSSLAAVCKYYLQQATPVLSFLHSQYSNIDQLNADLLRTDEALSEISKTLIGSESENVSGLENSRKSLLSRRDKAVEHSGELKNRIRTLDDQIRKNEKKLVDVEAKDKKVALAQRRVGVALRVRSTLERVLSLQTSSVRRKLNDDLQRVFSAISFKDYLPRIDDDFNLMLVKSDGSAEDQVAKSTGESQLLSLSFVGTIAQQAYKDLVSARSSEKGQNAGLVARAGGFYPIVMDSPFGNLDIDYQSSIAKVLPVLAPQVVVLVSRSQAGNVEAQLAPKVGRCYVINFHTDKIGYESTQFTAFGHTARIITATTSEPEWAEIVLVTDLED